MSGPVAPQWAGLATGRVVGMQGQAHRWRVVHVDMQARRSVVVLEGCRSSEAASTAEAMFGEALYLSTIRLHVSAA